MSPALAARLRDVATVLMLEETSWRSPRDHLSDACAGCGLPFWIHAKSGLTNTYCSDVCRFRANSRVKRGRPACLLVAS